MRIDQVDDVDARDLALRLEREIHERTGRRVRQLSVEFLDGQVSVRGWTSSYYAKQLVLQTVREFVPDTCLEHKILVLRAGDRPWDSPLQPPTDRVWGRAQNN